MGRLVDGVLNKIIKYFKSRKEKKLEEQKRLDYIQKRVMEFGTESYKNHKEENKADSKRYFFDSETYGEIF